MKRELQKKNMDIWQDPSAKPYVRVEHLSKSFDGHQILKDINLAVYKTELFSLLGGSGCGKTTLLRILAGLEMPDSGKIFIDDIDMSDIPAYRRPVSMVFQSYALFPHLTVEENVAFGLKQEKLPVNEIHKRVDEILELVHMNSFRTRKPQQLSGGQKQRVALARSLVKKPKLLLLDEPLSALDKNLREITQLEIVNIQETLGITFIMVSHDQEEAMTMSSRIGIMNEGRILQVGMPSEIYEYPNSKYVADFIGSINIFEGVITAEEADVYVVKSTLNCELHVKNSSSAPIGAHILVAVRPEKITISKTNPEKRANCLSGIVYDIVYLGDVSIYHIKLPNGRIALATVANYVRIAERPITWDDEVFLYWQSENSIFLSI